MYKNILLVLSTVLYITQTDYLWSMQPSFDNGLNCTSFQLSSTNFSVSNVVLAGSFAYITSAFQSQMYFTKLGKNIAIAGTCGIVYSYCYLYTVSHFSYSNEIGMYTQNMVSMGSAVSGAIIGLIF